MKNPKVFIVILHFGDPKNTRECLKSLENLEYDNFETIVIDNDKNNRGFAGGNNIGIKQALEKGTSYVLLLNNDTVVKPDFLKRLVEVGEGDEKIGILGPVIYEYGTDKIHFAGGKINWLYTKGIHQTNQSCSQRLNLRNARRPSEAPYSVLASLPRRNIGDHARSAVEVRKSSLCSQKIVDYITGCCLLIKREVIEKIGLMPEDYFLYFEDVEWCLRARRAGFRCVVVQKAIISHKVSSSAKEGSFSYIYYHTRNGLLLARNNAPFYIRILAYLQSIWIYIKQIIKLIFFPQKRVWAKAIMRGIGDFYRGRFGKYENWN